MKRSIIMACAFIAYGSAFGGFADQAKQLREREEKAAMEQEKENAALRKNIKAEVKSAYKAAEYAVGIRVINTASSWMIEVKDPISFGGWIQLPKATNPLSEDNVCYITALKDFKVRVLDRNTQQPVPGSEMTIKRGSGQDVFAINVRSVSAGKSVPTISYEALTAENARTVDKFENINL